MKTSLKEWWIQIEIFGSNHRQYLQKGPGKWYNSVYRKITHSTLSVMPLGRQYQSPQSPDRNIIKAVWDHLDRGRNKRHPTSKKGLWIILFEKPGKLNLKATWNHRKVPYWRELRSHWRIKVIMPNIVWYCLWSSHFELNRIVQIVFMSHILYFHVYLHMFQEITVKEVKGV